MKKVLLLLAIMLVAVSVSACSMQKETTSDENIVPINTSDEDNYNSADDLSASAPVNNSGASEATSTPATEKPAEIKKNMTSPDKQEDLVKKYSQAIIKTSLGNITVKLYSEESPITVNNFLSLAQSGFYNGTKFHRVIKDFMIQGGDPLSKETNAALWGTGGPGYKFKDEINSHKLILGSLAMANSGPNTNGSQFFIVTIAETPWLDGKHTNFGQVTAGMDIVKKIEATQTAMNDRPVEDISIISIELLK